MADYRKKDITIRYVSYGILIGLIFPLLSFIISSFTGKGSFTFQGFFQLHSTFSPQYLFDILFVFGGISGYYLSRYVYLQNSRYKNVLQQGNAESEKILDYTKKLIQNELDTEIHLNSSSGDLENSLNDLREHLKNNIIEQASRKSEDDQRNWVSEGLAKFAEILRSHTDNMEEFSYHIISNLILYLDANQGGFFLIEENEEGEKFFNMTASYAYDRRKFADRRIEWGEGLIGTCALEKESVYLSDIPESYLTVTSGLGKANPKYLLIVPLLLQEEVFGVLELASFQEFPAHKIDFVERVAESIAITISSVRSNIRTTELLMESRKQAEAMADQEEKMRQSMNELTDFQEQAAKQAEKFISFTNSVNHTLIRAEYDTSGILTYANTRFLRKLGYLSNTEVEGKHISMFINEKDREWFDELWARLAEGGRHYEGYMKHMTKMGQDLWTMSTYTCVRKDDGSVDKILFLAIDTTEQKKQSLDYEGQIEAINRLNIKAEFAPDGKFINCNELFLDTMKFTRSELEEMTIFDFIDKKDIENFNEIWENVTRGIPYQGQVKGLTKYEDEKWFRATYTAVNDMYGEVAKVIYLANEITNEKLMEIETRKQTDQLKVQEEKLRLSGVELKKQLEQTKADMEIQYKDVVNEKNRFEQTIGNLTDIVLSVDQSGNIIYVNSSAEKFWDVKLTKIRGKNAAILFPGYPDDYDSFIVSFLTAMSTKITGERKHVRIRNGKGKWIDTDMILSMSETDHEVSYTAFFRI